MQPLNAQINPSTPIHTKTEKSNEIFSNITVINFDNMESHPRNCNSPLRSRVEYRYITTINLQGSNEYVIGFY